MKSASSSRRHLPVVGAFIQQKSSKILSSVSLEWTQGPALGLHCRFLDISPLSPHLPSSLINNCFNLPFGVKGKSRDGGLRTAFTAKRPIGSCSVSALTLLYIACFRKSCEAEECEHHGAHVWRWVGRRAQSRVSQGQQNQMGWGDVGLGTKAAAAGRVWSSKLKTVTFFSILELQPDFPLPLRESASTRGSRPPSGLCLTSHGFPSNPRVRPYTEACPSPRRCYDWSSCSCCFLLLSRNPSLHVIKPTSFLLPHDILLCFPLSEHQLHDVPFVSSPLLPFSLLCEFFEVSYNILHLCITNVQHLLPHNRHSETVCWFKHWLSIYLYLPWLNAESALVRKGHVLLQPQKTGKSQWFKAANAIPHSH